MDSYTAAVKLRKLAMPFLNEFCMINDQSMTLNKKVVEDRHEVRIVTQAFPSGVACCSTNLRKAADTAALVMIIKYIKENVQVLGVKHKFTEQLINIIINDFKVELTPGNICISGTGTSYDFIITDPSHVFKNVTGSMLAELLADYVFEMC